MITLSTLWAGLLAAALPAGGYVCDEAGAVRISGVVIDALWLNQEQLALLGDDCGVYLRAADGTGDRLLKRFGGREPFGLCSASPSGRVLAVSTWRSGRRGAKGTLVVHLLSMADGATVWEWALPYDPPPACGSFEHIVVWREGDEDHLFIQAPPDASQWLDGGEDGTRLRGYLNACIVDLATHTSRPVRVLKDVDYWCRGWQGDLLRMEVGDLEASVPVSGGAPRFQERPVAGNDEVHVETLGSTPEGLVVAVRDLRGAESGVRVAAVAAGEIVGQQLFAGSVYHTQLNDDGTISVVVADERYTDDGDLARLHLFRGLLGAAVEAFVTPEFKVPTEAFSFCLPSAGNRIFVNAW